MFGGVQAVTWTDVKMMVLIVFGLFAVIGTALIGLPEERERDRRAGGGRDRPAGCAASTSRSISPTSTRSGPGRSPPSSCSAPTSAPIRARCSAISPRVSGRGAAFAADERLLEDPAPGRWCCSSACWCSSSMCSRRRRCSSAALPTSGCGRAALPANTRRCVRRHDQALQVRRAAALEMAAARQAHDDATAAAAPNLASASTSPRSRLSAGRRGRW